MKKNNKKLKLFSLILLIIFCLYFQTVAYSAINSTMTIKGDAYARVDADVRITNFKLSSSSSNSTSSYEEFSVNTIASKFNLLDSSSSIVFDVEVTNYGSSDVGILQLVGTVPTGLSYEIINYNLKDKICDDTGKCNQMAVKTFQIKFTGTPGEYEVNLELDFRTYHKVSYIEIENNNYPTEVIDGGNLSITFTENLKKVTILSDGTEIEHYEQINSGQTINISNVFGEIEIRQEPNILKIVSGDLDTVGSEICIGKECFYVISSTDDSVTMLAKYNLYVGNIVDNSNWSATPLSNPTGKQNSSAKGISVNLPFVGTTEFANDNYKGTNYNIYSGSLVETYVNDYKQYLLDFDVFILNARLINASELSTLGCNLNNISCASAPSWVYSTSYWTGVPGDGTRVYIVYGGDGEYNSYDYYLDNRFGVRPVIEIPKWAFNETFEFTIDGVTYEAKEGMTWGDWVDSSYDTRGFVNNNDLIYTDDLMYALVYEVDNGSYTSYSWPYIDDLIDPNLVYVTFNEAGEDGEW